jgi:glycogen debranching enzyme
MVKKNILDEAYEKAIEVVNQCSTKHGLYASGGFNGYKGVWSRDSNITLIGASTNNNPLFKEQWKKSLEILKHNQSKLGQIPNAVLKFERKNPEVDYKSIDSNLWFLIGHYFYKKRYHDSTLFKEHENAIKKALTWLYYMDVGEDTTLEQLPTTDWEDAFPNKYGATINTQALYYFVLDLVGDKKRLKKLSYAVNKNKDNQLWNKTFYWAYRWKNHNKYKEIGDWFDSLGNLLAIISGLSNRKMSISIIKHIKKHNLDKPYPLKCIYPTIKPGSEYWEDYYYDAKATPNHYLNGGIWPFIGGFYCLALIKLGMFKEAQKQLEILAESNLKENLFPEWIDPINKNTHGSLQAWSAGTYIWAYNSLKKKKVL